MTTCEKCGFEINYVDKTYQGVTSKKKVNPDGSSHNFNLGGKWVCVTSKEHIEWTKAHNGPSGFVSKPSTNVNNSCTADSRQTPLKQTELPKQSYQFTSLDANKIELVQTEARITYEIYLAVKAEIVEEPNGPVLGMIFNQVCENLRLAKERKDKE